MVHIAIQPPDNHSANTAAHWADGAKVCLRAWVGANIVTDSHVDRFVNGSDDHGVHEQAAVVRDEGTGANAFKEFKSCDIRMEYAREMNMSMNVNMYMSMNTNTNMKGYSTIGFRTQRAGSSELHRRSRSLRHSSRPWSGRGTNTRDR